MKLLKSIIDPEQLKLSRSFFSNDGKEIQYKPLFNFINHNMIDIIQKQMNWSIFKYSKMRISDNNNNTDAAAFHRDLIYYGDSKKMAPIYTCLCYLDEGTMEIMEKKIKKIKIPSGSILIFNSQTIHRGVFNKNKGQKHRRLIQLFECFGTEQDFNLYYPKILFVPAKTNNGKLIQSFQKNYPFLFSIINFISYKNALSGYNKKQVRKWLNQNNYNSIDFISSDAQQLRWDYDWSKNTQTSNLYIYSLYNHNDLAMEHHKKLKSLQYTFPYVYYSFLYIFPIILLLIVIIILVIKKFIK
jgi:hypothetical protein